MNEKSFRRLYAEHAQSVYAFLAYRTGNRVLAEDLLSETFERVIRSRARYDPRKGTEKTWLYSIARNALTDHLRREAAEQRALERATVADETADRTDPLDLVAERDAVGRALATLSDEERESVALRYGGDLSMPQIARLLGEPLTTVDSRVHRALRKMRAVLGDGAGTEADQAAR
jgi:RNA polymerase sigma factor (sigma-70 family)